MGEAFQTEATAWAAAPWERGVRRSTEYSRNWERAALGEIQRRGYGIRWRWRGHRASPWRAWQSGKPCATLVFCSFPHKGSALFSKCHDHSSPSVLSLYCSCPGNILPIIHLLRKALLISFPQLWHPESGGGRQRALMYIKHLLFTKHRDESFIHMIFNTPALTLWGNALPTILPRRKLALRNLEYLVQCHIA